MNLARMKKIIAIVEKYRDLHNCDTAAEHDEFHFGGPKSVDMSADDLVAFEELGVLKYDGDESWFVFT